MPRPRLSDEERKRRIQEKNKKYYAENKEKWVEWRAKKLASSLDSPGLDSPGLDSPDQGKN